MKFIDLVSNRFSCRKFLNKPIAREKLIKCIEAARLAPSACNSQPWKFIVVDDPEIKEKLANIATSKIYGVINRFLPTAPCIIVVLADREKFIAEVGGVVMGTDYYLIDIGIASEHFVLAATELGLGTCFIGYFNEKGIKKLLNIPRKYKIPIMIAVGYPDTIYRKKDTTGKVLKSSSRKKLDEIISFNGWGVSLMSEKG